jgi:hypothetical protein
MWMGLYKPCGGTMMTFFFRVRVVVGQTATVSSIFFLHLVGCCFLLLVCYCVRVRFDGSVDSLCISSMTVGFAERYGE